jgi:hypothetical protein
MVASLSAQDQLATLMADAMPEQILSFKFDMGTQSRITELIAKKQEGQLAGSEQEELEKYLMYDLLIGLAKARAFRHLNA